ncbi:hypothetical protein [Variovorax sp. KK3]|uniref:hypothetical protein n=1 Tax=Variovorax sp. KK3 TaxID=1855728 RepID=UPI0011801554|nr:hypothetical protein [Variovorax sp. KK3]
MAPIERGPFVVDGEICVLDDLGRSNFDKLEDRARRRRWSQGAEPVTFAVFYLVVENGIDIAESALQPREAAVASFMKTLKVEDIYIGGYETFADVAARLPRVHRRRLQRETPVLGAWLPVTRRVRRSIAPVSGLDLPLGDPARGVHFTRGSVPDVA